MNLAPQAAVFRVPHHADDFVAGTRRAVCAYWRFAKLFPERVFLAEVFFDECLIHNHRSWRRSRSRCAVRRGQLEIGSIESAAGKKWNVQRLKEIWSHAEHVRSGLLILRGARPVEHFEVTLTDPVTFASVGGVILAV